MSGDPLVSIVTPTLQRADLLEQTLASVAAQRYARIEHIVVDGGSTDGTIDLLRDRERETALRWISERDEGMYEAINKGLEMARGEIVAYLNSDDLYFPWTVSTVVAAFNRYPTAAVIYGDAIHLDEARNELLPNFMPPLLRQTLAAHGSIVQPAVFMRRTVLDAIGGFDPSLKYVADLDLWLRALPSFPFQHVDEFLAIDRHHAGSLTLTNRASMADEESRARRVSGPMRWTAPARAQAGRFVRAFWWRYQWVRFVVACRTPNVHRRWPEFIMATRPAIESRLAIEALVPRGGWHRMAEMRLTASPLTVAVGDPRSPGVSS